MIPNEKYCKICKDGIPSLLIDGHYLCIRIAIEGALRQREFADYSVPLDCPYYLEQVVEDENSR